MLLSLLSALFGKPFGTPTPVTATVALETYHQLDLTPLIKELSLSPSVRELSLYPQVHAYDLTPLVRELF